MVILLIGMLFIIMSNVFKPDNRSKIYAETCVNKVFGEVRNYINKSTNSKSLAYSGTTYDPDSYSIIFDTWSNTVYFKFDYNGSWYNYSNLQLSGTKLVIKECTDNSSYSVIMSGNISLINIIKNPPHQTISTKLFEIKPDARTGQIEFWLREWPYTRMLSKIIIDGRIPNAVLNRCMDLPAKDKTQSCLKRSL